MVADVEGSISSPSSAEREREVEVKMNKDHDDDHHHNNNDGKEEEVGSPIYANPRRTLGQRIQRYLALDEEVHHDHATIPLAWMAMLTGMVDGAIYSRAEVWTGFQTGNTVQVALGITTYIFPRTPTSIPREPLLLLLRSLSLIAFFLGSLLGARLGQRFGEKRRGYLVGSSILQGLLLFGAAGILLSRPEQEGLTFQWWPGIIVLIAFSMGLQSIQAQKIASPVFSTSVAFTATMTQIASDPHLFSPSTSLPSPMSMKLFISSSSTTEHHKESASSRSFWGNPSVKGRDLRIFALVSLAIGGGIAQTLLEAQTGIGLKGTMSVTAGAKLFLAILWFIPKGKRIH